MENTPIKICTQCKSQFPAHKQYFYANKNSMDGLGYICKKCLGHPFGTFVTRKTAPLGFKCCTHCNRVLPATQEYYDIQSKNKLRQPCRECRGYSFRKIPQIGSKVCSKCNRELPATLEYFYKAKEGKYNVGKTCKECHGAKFGCYRNDNNVPEGFRKCRRCGKVLPKTIHYFYLNKSWNNFFGVCKKCSIDIQKTPHVKKRRKVFYSKHKEEIMLKAKEWRQTSRGKLSLRIRNHIKQQKRKRLPYFYTKDLWLQCVDYFEGKCCYCGQEEKLEHEHFIPFSKDGEYTRNNILPACRRCNFLKGKKDFFDWYPNQSFYSKQREKKILNYLGYESSRNIQQLKLAM